MKARPVIAMSVPAVVGAEECRWLDRYVTSLAACGAVPWALPFVTLPEILGRCVAEADGVLLVGGKDIDPHFYGEEFSGAKEAAPGRDAFEQMLIPEVVRLDKPLLGICRGIQSLNVFMGGTLHQDIAARHPGQEHEVTILGGHLAEIYGVGAVKVNSHHHQAVKVAAPGFEVTARTADGLIEAIERPASRLVLGVQWHPEKIFFEDAAARKLIEHFVDVCRG
ncbi:MAG: hypothetical protein A3K19_11985 [Lentisphaerae bacterium RIFOXYB12_FULL_65_16]|nr:MAG: hypothetical protein A3K18_17455 [Lentisphaerae bacterium RIFOXYA12_64_32]OGV95146.1 MAG: hypothetical protein A3K19_11985 [Lentisphaerae bacterium RIFOXYB12_FULL_65_16]